jgi:hypothetical protein
METENDNNKKKETEKIGGLLFVGCMFLGMAAGYYMDRMIIGLFAGIGLGFILRAVVLANYRNK